MKTIKFKVTQKDLEDYEKYFEEISDYPAYMHTSGLTRADGVILAKVLRNQFWDNGTVEYEVTIKIKDNAGSKVNESVETKQAT